MVSQLSQLTDSDKLLMLRNLLLDLEWRGDSILSCPQCFREKKFGHQNSCELQTVLNETLPGLDLPVGEVVMVQIKEESCPDCDGACNC